MGWNSWNTFGQDINETVVRETADALVATGLKDHGYSYIVIDDCWSIKDRRDGNGDLIPDPEKFPGGRKALADYVHDKGFKLGIYSDAAEKTCAGYPGSLGFEDQDARLWVSWGIDFLKYDYCNAPCSTRPPPSSAIPAWVRRSTARAVSSSSPLCEWGNQAPHLWGRQAGGQMWRVAGDVFDSWVDIQTGQWHSLGIDSSIDVAQEVHAYGGPGGWNDLDMLVVGLKGRGQTGGTGLSFLEYQTHMSVWVMACSPLMIGCDVRRLDAETASLLMNREVLDVNQDALGIPAGRVRQAGPCEIWTKRLTGGSMAVSVINRGSQLMEVTVKTRALGLLDTPKLARNLWSGQDIIDFKADLPLRVAAHQTLLFKISQ